MAASNPHTFGWRLRTIALGVAMATSLASGAMAQVEMRGAALPLSAEVVAVGPEGVTVAQGDGQSVISWDRVRAVRSVSHADAAKVFAERAERLWRARSRVERGDFASAEPLLEALASGGAGGLSGPSAEVVFESLLRCRLHRGSVTGAVWAWLDWRRVRAATGAARTIGGSVDATPVIDVGTGLVPTLPPMFVNDPATGVGVQSAEWGRFAAAGSKSEPTDAKVKALAELYLAAARFDTGVAVQVGEIASTDAGVKLVADVVLSRAGNEAQRKAARAALESRLEGEGDAGSSGWVECWCRLALGRAMLREGDDATRRLGVIHLMHVPARFARLSPMMASMALADAAAGLNELGDAAGAQAVKAELLARYPRQPAANDARLREIKSLSPETSGADASASVGSGGQTP